MTVHYKNTQWNNKKIIIGESELNSGQPPRLLIGFHGIDFMALRGFFFGEPMPPALQFLEGVLGEKGRNDCVIESIDAQDGGVVRLLRAVVGKFRKETAHRGRFMKRVGPQERIHQCGGSALGKSPHTDLWSMVRELLQVQARLVHHL